MVGLETTSYTVSESDEVVDICINAAGANTDCPSSDPFQLTLSTADQTAGTAIDSNSNCGSVELIEHINHAALVLLDNNTL